MQQAKVSESRSLAPVFLGCFEPTSIKIDSNKAKWRVILASKKLAAHKQHYYSGSDVMAHEAVSHVRLTMAPDGGISRMRLWGRKSHVTNGGAV